MTDTSTAPAVAQRPALITFVGILTLIQAFAALGIAILWFIGAFSDTVADTLGEDRTGVIVTVAVVELLFALFFFAVARGVFSGAPWARMWLTVVAGFRIATAGVLSAGALAGLDVDNGGYGLLSMLMPLAVLFVLWGTEKGQAFFAAK
ncbi:hypothetical protein [Demequina lignilytica]|uniref:Uncharacterized protein n=1 Tax=Demequina lignilytica TaxID=3051663 RepID=A0AB35MIB6_9MICO|nr:hypothetical protein [Demequina sp. SYSU T0a273]MDN4483508.1 hypothetical protein [Demequina sp. SYSU T0a273]